MEDKKEAPNIHNKKEETNQRLKIKYDKELENLELENLKKTKIKSTSKTPRTKTPRIKSKDPANNIRNKPNSPDYFPLVRPNVKLTKNVYQTILKYAPVVPNLKDLYLIAGVSKMSFFRWLDLGERLLNKYVDKEYEDNIDKYLLDNDLESKTIDKSLCNKDLEGKNRGSLVVPKTRFSANVFHKRCMSLYIELGKIWANTNIRLFAKLLANEEWRAIVSTLKLRLDSTCFDTDRNIRGELENLNKVTGGVNKKKKELTIEQKRAIAEIAGVKFDE